MSNPTLISVPFANGGNKNTIQTTRQVGQNAQDATWTDGFPSITMTPISAGGLPPKGLDFNGIFYALSDNVVHRLKGLSVQFSATYAAAIGGYPLNAKVELNDGSAIVQSTVANNMNDPNSSMTGWRIYSGYDVLDGKLNITDFQKQTAIISAASGTADAITASYTPAITVLSNGMSLFVRAASANTTTTPTFTPNSGTIAAKTIVKGNGLALAAGDIAGGGHWIELQYDATLDKWVLLNPATGVSSQQKQMQSLTASVASNALTVTYAGGTLDFRNATLSNGTSINGVQVPSNSITVPSGATLGTTNGVAARLILLEAYNGGSPVLCVANLSGGLQLDETNLISPTTISSGATSASTIYSASAVSANSPYRIVGFIDITEATAGTWATAPTEVQGVGGLALAAIGSLGVGQTWQDMTASRALGTIYTNTSGKPIVVTVSASVTTVNNLIQIMSNGVPAGISTQANQTSQIQAATATIPNGANYQVPSTGLSLVKWTELR